MKLIFREDLHFWPIRVLMCYFYINKSVTYYFFRLGQILLKIKLFKNQGDYKLLLFIKKSWFYVYQKKVIINLNKKKFTFFIIFVVLLN